MELFKNFKDLWRGVALALVISVPAWLLGKQFEVIGGPVFAILIGMALGLVLRHRAGVVEATSAGIKYTSNKILQYAVILLGFGIVQIGLALKGHDASQRAQGFMTFFGGVVIYFAKDILDMIL